MTDVFSAILKTSVQGSIVILAVIALRFLLKKAPKSLFCLLWLLAGLRLALPYEIQSSFSLQPRMEDTSISIQTQQPIQLPEIGVQNPEGQPQGTPVDPVLPPEVPEGNWENIQTDSYVYWAEYGAITGPADLGGIAAWVWFLGAAAMVTASAVSYWKLKRRVREAFLIENGCFECPGLDTAFVLGFLPPRIYLPLGLSDQEKKFIFDHENTHIARHDHWFKVLGYVVLSIHWFNPLVWLGYGLLCRDMELACDEHVVKYMTLPERKAYSAALLSCGGKTARISACAVAFGESNPKKRILNVLNYKRPSFWIVLLAVIAVIFVSVCLLTSPESQTEMIPETEIQESQNLQDTEEVAYIAKCREAMIELYSAPEWYVRRETPGDPTEVVYTYYVSKKGWMYQYRRPQWDYDNISWLYYNEEQIIYVGTHTEESPMTPPYFWQEAERFHDIPLLEEMDPQFWEEAELDLHQVNEENGFQTVTLRKSDTGEVFNFYFMDEELLYYDQGMNRFYVRFPLDGTVDEYLAHVVEEATAKAEKKPTTPGDMFYEELFNRQIYGANEGYWIYELFRTFYLDPEEFISHLAGCDRAEEIIEFMSDDLGSYAPERFRYTLEQIPDMHHPEIVKLLKGICGAEIRQSDVTCNDPKCTDSAHDHSGVSCTDKNCTNSTHHHNDEHHDDKHHH